MPCNRNPEPSLSVREVCSLLGVNKSTVKRRIESGHYPHSIAQGNGGPQFRIPLSCLPTAAQHQYLAQQIKQRPPAERRPELRRLNLQEHEERDVARAAGVTRKPRAPASSPLTTKEANEKRLAFERLPVKSRDEAQRRYEIMCALAEFDPSVPMMQRYRALSSESGESASTLQRWQRAIRGHDRRDWIPFLAPDRRGGRPSADVSEPAWAFILNEWLVQSRPALLPIYRRALAEASRLDWRIPSYRTIKRRVDALPAHVTAYQREGEEALDRFFPNIQRDYSTLPLHQLWCSDGRKADVFCRWPDGFIGRPTLMAWQELRSRKILGWAASKVESTELARLSFRDAATRSGAIPSEAYMDNGRAYASKQFTGGQPVRNRFKVNPEDPHGLLSLFGIKPIWATPYRGQVKPIESFWNTIAEGERCAAFAGSYCGNRPDAKPEEFDPRKAVPIEHYLAFVAETIAAKNAAPHRGDSMDGKSPDAIYAELFETTPLRHPTEAQLRLCMQAVENVRLDRGHGLTILGNRYWCEELAALPHRGPYTARFNPENAAESVAVYEGGRFICEAPLTLRTGFRDVGAAKEHAREKSRAKRAVREQARALAGMERAERSWERTSTPAPNDGKASPTHLDPVQSDFPGWPATGGAKHRADASQGRFFEPGAPEQPAIKPPTPKIPRLVHTSFAAPREQFEQLETVAGLEEEQRRFEESLRNGLRRARDAREEMDKRTAGGGM